MPLKAAAVVTVVRCEPVDAAEAKRLCDPMRDLYAEVYAEPPYREGTEHVARFVDHYAQALSRDGFSLAVAFAGDRLAGAAYGRTMAAGTWFGSPVGDPPPEILNAPKFFVTEWMVRQAYRRQGAGRRLLDLLLADRGERYAVLSCNPAVPARQIYERYGWRLCGHTAPELLPPMDTLAIRLS